MNKILVLYDCKHPPCFVSKTAFIGGAMDMIDLLRQPHGRLFTFQEIYKDELVADELINAWYEVNTAVIPDLFSENYLKYDKAFQLLWEAGKLVYQDV